MKRYASHFLFLPGYGYLRQFAVEMEGGHAVRIFPLSEEVENTEWLPGVILLLDEDIRPDITSYEPYFDTSLILSPVSGNLSYILEKEKGKPVSFIPYLLFPFNFTTMRPVAGTRHRRLR
ncbi:hypothetical protein [Bacteroides fluxus]|uniref:hypothetical protein n=1 Tax=Bacteroides fluxus TaxID=626930 RepID=UPI0005865B47|nr:hypothetical protein [Bacteroides fluxus]